jgi:hypothetical protein
MSKFEPWTFVIPNKGHTIELSFQETLDFFNVWQKFEILNIAIW